MFLLVLLAVVMARAQEPEISLGEVARQNRAEKKAEAKVVVDDQEHDQEQAATPEDDSLCGDPVPVMQEVYASALLNQKAPEEAKISEALLGWLADHPDLKKMDPSELAKADQPYTQKQAEADQQLADRIAQSFADEMVEFKKGHTEEETHDRLNKLLEAKSAQRQADVLDSAVRDEKQRRAAGEGKTQTEKDRLEQAVNLYAICENKRLIASDNEVEKLTKAALKAKLAAAGFEVN